MKDLFFISAGQIALGRRFISDVMYAINATLNTNELRLSLSSVVGITNNGSTFPQHITTSLPSQPPASSSYLRCLRHISSMTAQSQR